MLNVKLLDACQFFHCNILVAIFLDVFDKTNEWFILILYKICRIIK